MNILIVDDNEINRALLIAILESYQEEHALTFHFDEAEDGQEAVMLSQKSKYDLIFMDIMMPNMNGIDATSAIKKTSKNAMIIAVSAIDNEEKQDEILRVGAEDYIHKPINRAILIKRLENYFKLIKTRKQKRTLNTSKNLFLKPVYNYTTRYTITNDEDLALFWELTVDKLSLQLHNGSGLSDVVRILYTLATPLMQKQFTCDIFIEEDEANFYFSITNMNLFSLKKIEPMIEATYNKSFFKKEGKLITLLLPKQLSETTEISNTTPPVEVKKESQYKSSTESTVFHFMQASHQEELSEFLQELDSTMMLVGSSDLTRNEISHIKEYLINISDICSIYDESADISDSVYQLAKKIEEHIDVFESEAYNIAKLAQTFSTDLGIWYKKIFVTGASDVAFMNDSIKANSETIIQFLEPATESDENIDDIFDF
jgi:CheY-like chemotaxis protein